MGFSSDQGLFQSYFIGGFECSTHTRRDGRRLDLLAQTAHDRFAAQDFARLHAHGIHTARSGIRWHLIEPSPYRYRFESIVPYLHTAEASGMQVIYDLCHYGYPADLDPFSPRFVDRFAALARAFARVYASETDQPAIFCPMNEISFFSWGGGDVGYLNPFAHDRGFALKQNLVRASIAAMEAVWDVIPSARFAHIEPVIRIIAHPDRPEETPVAEGYRLRQFQAWDMIAGWLSPELGGAPRYLDVIGMNYYSNNQWIHCDRTVWRDDPLYLPFRHLAAEVYARYRRPLFVAETGVENEARPDWLRYMAGECAALRAFGVPVDGLCLYPIICHPGWDDERHCYNGLWDYANEAGEREVCEPMAEALREAQAALTAVAVC